MRVNKLVSINHKRPTVFMEDKAARLEEREKAVNAIVHEIRNPLTAIKLTNQLMQEVFENDEKSKLLMQSYMMIVANNIEKIENYLTEALTYRKRQVSLEPVNICNCIDKALCASKDRLYLSNIMVSQNCKGSHWVYGNEEKLVTAFLNIIINSIEAIKKENGRIWIRVYTTNNTVRVTFKDNGTGMEPSTAEKIFDPHFSTKDGIGIGLYNVKEIINLHKANIITNSLPGVGTSLSILFKSLPDEDIPVMETGKRARVR